VRVRTLQIVLTLVPIAVFTYVRTFLRVVKEHVGRSPEILLPVRVVALTPLMFLVN
jgi:hypothetical protein